MWDTYLYTVDTACATRRSDNHLGHEDSPTSIEKFHAWSGNVNATNVETFAWTLLNFIQLRTTVYQGPIMGAWGSDCEATPLLRCVLLVNQKLNDVMLTLSGCAAWPQIAL